MKGHTARSKWPIGLACIFMLSAATISTLRVSTSSLTLVTVVINHPRQFLASIPLATPSSNASRSDFIIDFLSIGSLDRSDYLNAQKRTFASHPLVRNFFSVTEEDDADSTCYLALTLEQLNSVSDFCRSKIWRKGLMPAMRSQFAHPNWLAKKKNPTGWMCAQKRPMHGLTKAIRKYRQDGETRLPDYFIIIDDDTYYNVPLFYETMKDKDLDVPTVTAGCMVRRPIREVNFTFPFGGYGTIFNRAALENLMRPISCHPYPQDDEFAESACRRLEENQIGEQPLFRDGMSISDLIEAYTSFQPFSAVGNWTTGYCLHSDWIWGYFTNFYNVSIHVSDPIYENVPHSRLEGYLDSELYGGRPTPSNLLKRKQCDNDSIQSCTNDSHICHYQTPQSMASLTSQWLMPS